MPLRETTVVANEHGHEITKRERKLYTLAELKALDDRPAPEQDDEISSDAFEKALGWISQGESEFWSGEDDLENYIQPEHFGLAGITFDAKKAEYNVGYGGIYFVLPRGTSIDTPVFLRALKAWAEGRDYRGKDYAKDNRKVILHPHSQHKIDLRSKDARIAREHGLIVHTVSTMWSHSSDEFDLDYHYEGMSDAFKNDCNAFLSDLCHEAARLLDSEYEYITGDREYLMDTAEVNEYTFDRNGKIA